MWSVSQLLGPATVTPQPPRTYGIGERGCAGRLCLWTPKFEFPMIFTHDEVLWFRFFPAI